MAILSLTKKGESFTNVCFKIALFSPPLIVHSHFFYYCMCRWQRPDSFINVSSVIFLLLWSATSNRFNKDCCVWRNREKKRIWIENKKKQHKSCPFFLTQTKRHESIFLRERGKKCRQQSPVKQVSITCLMFRKKNFFLKNILNSFLSLARQKKERRRQFDYKLNALNFMTFCASSSCSYSLRFGSPRYDTYAWHLQ